MAATSQLIATLRLGLAQIDSKLGDVAANVDKACGLINDGRQRVDLLVFPELALTGYAVGSRFHELALRVDSPLFQRLVDNTEGVAVAIGFVEETDAFQFFNSLAFIKDRQLLRIHRKIY